MIGKEYTYLLNVNTKDDFDKLDTLVYQVSNNHFPKYLYSKLKSIKHLERESCLLEITLDLKKYKIVVLHGYIEHSFYPSNKTYKNDLDKFIDWYRNEYLIMKDVSIVKHIPHSSYLLPDNIINTNVDKYLLKMCDIGVDFLFRNIKGKEIKAKYSRLYCDVERFKDDTKEEMAKYGQGYIYIKAYDGHDIIRLTNKKIKEDIDNYYDNHHKLLNETVKNELEKGKKVLILDLHSFSEEQANSLCKSGEYPDICIGINQKYIDKQILNLVIRKIKEKGLSYKINYPYKGSIIPSEVLSGKIKGEVYSIMIEVNKKLYL